MPPTAVAPDAGFQNAPDTDPALAVNRQWLSEALAASDIEPRAPLVDAVSEIDAALESVRGTLSHQVRR